MPRTFPCPDMQPHWAPADWTAGFRAVYYGSGVLITLYCLPGLHSTHRTPHIHTHNCPRLYTYQLPDPSCIDLRFPLPIRPHRICRCWLVRPQLFWFPSSDNAQPCHGPDCEVTAKRLGKFTCPPPSRLLLVIRGLTGLVGQPTALHLGYYLTGPTGQLRASDMPLPYLPSPAGGFCITGYYDRYIANCPTVTHCGCCGRRVPPYAISPDYITKFEPSDIDLLPRTTFPVVYSSPS